MKNFIPSSIMTLICVHSLNLVMDKNVRPSDSLHVGRPIPGAPPSLFYTSLDWTVQPRFGSPGGALVDSQGREPLVFGQEKIEPWNGRQ